jgi:hypothetical protein
LKPWHAFCSANLNVIRSNPKTVNLFAKFTLPTSRGPPCQVASSYVAKVMVANYSRPSLPSCKLLCPQKVTLANLPTFMCPILWTMCSFSPSNEMKVQGWIIIQMDDGWNWLTKWNAFEWININHPKQSMSMNEIKL